MITLVTKPKPLLIVSDSVSCTSGLGRITRDLATRIHSQMPEFRVATCGYGGPGSSHFGWPEYHIHDIKDWLIPELPLIAKDFVRDDEELTLFVIWDASRVGWIANPAQCPVPMLRRWLETVPMKKWIYGAIDAEGPNGGLSVKLANTLKGFDRVLNYSKFSSKVTGYPDFLPHGIDTEQFIPHDKSEAKERFRQAGFSGLKQDSFLVGIVATNQARKDYALAIQTCRLLLDRGVDVRIWIHVDELVRYWDLGALVVDYELHKGNRVVITCTNYSDEQMNGLYSACDVTLGIGAGEGFGLPIFESLASGTPVVHGDYGGAAEHMEQRMLVTPCAYRYEGPYCMKRPVFEPSQWADRVLEVAGKPAELISRLSWKCLWPKWENWLREGLR